LFSKELGPFLRESILLLEEVAFLVKGFGLFPRESTLLFSKVLLSLKNLGPSLRKNHYSSRNFYSSFCKLFYKVLYLYF
jgi:hypothetical protein